MPREVFVDAGAWIGITNAGARHHPAARAIYRRLLAEQFPLVTTNLVVAEAYMLIRRGIGHRGATQFLQSLRHAGRVEKVYSDAALEQAAENILAQYSDQDFSLTDAVSFALMRSRQITEAFAFDHHFLIAGFTLVPAPA